jgi:hypothetical protein
MPAIDLTNLKFQSANLLNFFDQPDQFLHQLADLLESYTNQTLRINLVSLKSDLPSYRTPRPVMHQIESDLEKLGEQYPDEVVNLVLALWKASYYEARILAAFLLGTIPPNSAMTILSGLPEWLYETKDQEVKKALLTSALARLRKENPRVLLMLISEWLQSPGPKTQTWGLHAFVPLIKLLGYDDLPQLFKILRPAIETVSTTTQTDIQSCLSTLYSISPSETIHYISEIFQQNYDQRRRLNYLRLFRGLPTEMQKELDFFIKSNAIK